jgi:hypothetical protein
MSPHFFDIAHPYLIMLNTYLIEFNHDIISFNEFLKSVQINIWIS